MNTETNGQATYCPEDNKLRLYIGRVPRPEYEALRAQGWKALHKQREAGGGDFVAIWTPERYETAMRYAGGIVDDEDMGPAERAADRAERFAGYREKRLDDATGHADRYEAGPAVHGYQSEAKAERAAARHDRIGDKAGDAWSKAEYWQRRTAGVIGHALHLSDARTRMGRIKELEADLRRHEASGRNDEWTNHYRLRLAYENQMLEAQGGRAGAVEMIAGGFLRGGRHLGASERRIVKVNKSPASGRVVSVLVRDNFASTVNHYGNPFPDGITRVLLHTVKVERMSPDSYRAPTPDELAAFESETNAKKAEAKKLKQAEIPCPLVNPTDTDAERLQALWNEYTRQKWERHRQENPHRYTPEFVPSTVMRITQATYSANSAGSYSKTKTSNVCPGAAQEPTAYNYDGHLGKPRAKVRTTFGANYMADRVIVLTDKPQKPLPATVWQPLAPVEAKPEAAAV